MNKLLPTLLAASLLSISGFAQQNIPSADELSALQNNINNSVIIATPKSPSTNAYQRIMSGCDSITTTYASNNGLAGAMFDVIADSNLTINGMYTNLSVASGVFEIYYKPGTFIGFEQNSSAWTLLGSNSIISNGVDVPTLVPIPFSINMNAGDTIAFYISNTTGGSSGLKYTNSTISTGALYVTNGALRIYIGKGVTYPFGSGSIFSDRVWNGTLNYCTTTTGMNHLQEQTISVVPNPSVGNVQFSFGDKNISKFKLFSPEGKLIRDEKIFGSNFTLERNNLSNGVYFYQLTDDNNNHHTGKLIFE